MNILLEDEISRAKTDAIRDGYAKSAVDQWEALSRALLARAGFSSAAEVRRLADLHGRRR